DARTLTVDELLDQPRADCDVLIYPARLLGELVERGWVVNLSKSLSVAASEEAIASDASGSENIARDPPHWRSQATYGGVPMAVSLGCAIPSMVANERLYDALGEGPTDWNTLLGALGVDADSQP